MKIRDVDQTTLIGKAEAACQRIAPLWPLTNFVAVNPYYGLTHQSFWQAHETLERIVGVGLCMPRAYYREQIRRGRITRDDLAAALQECGSSRDVSAFEQLIAQDPPSSVVPCKLVTDILGEFDHEDWSGFVVERISRYCAAYFDKGQALWPLPWKHMSLYRAWRQFVRFDKSLRMLGVRSLREVTTLWPDTAESAIVQALQELDIPITAVDDYLYAALLSVGGWAAWTRYLRWQAELQGDNDDSIRDLLAIRLVWDVILYKYKIRCNEALKTRWQESAARIPAPVNPPDRELPVNAVLQTALEIGYQRQLIQSLNGVARTGAHSGRLDVQAVFCIDVRSEVFRRALESLTPGVRTMGFAGFFGIPMEYFRIGDTAGEPHLPVFFKPTYRIHECPDRAHREQETNKLIMRRHTNLHLAKAWKAFKTSASSAFAFVEAVGLLWAPKLIGDSMGWTRPVPEPDNMGLPVGVQRQLSPGLSCKVRETASAEGELWGIPEADRSRVAHLILRNMGMIKDFARLVVFVGHGSSTVNNPQASGLDCGACGGHSGEASARIAAALLNDPLTRRGLVQYGIEIPEDTYFMAGLHDTTTDEVQLFNIAQVPLSHTTDVAQLLQWLTVAGQKARIERANVLGIGHLPTTMINRDLRRRTRDWAEVRPEWALAGNAAFIAAPRTRTAHCDLAGRVFLHEYDWHHDNQFNTLQLIMTAPMLVAHWINMQYYGSMVDNNRFGSGNKVLHNVVGGAVGVLEGNGGDLRVGLALQSLHDGRNWIHEPIRLTVIIEAPQSAIDDVIAHHEKVRELVENAWVHLFQIDEDGHLNRRGLDRQWRRY